MGLSMVIMPQHIVSGEGDLNGLGEVSFGGLVNIMLAGVFELLFS